MSLIFGDCGHDFNGNRDRIDRGRRSRIRFSQYPDLGINEPFRAAVWSLESTDQCAVSAGYPYL